MHKEEAGMLFECLGNPNRVKIVKCIILSYISPSNFLNLLKKHYSCLLSKQIVKRKALYLCHKIFQIAS